MGDNNLGSVRPAIRPAIQDFSVRMNISNTNEYFFPILYTFITYNPPMNPVKCRQDQIQNGRLIAILFAQIDIIFENFVRPDAYISNTNKYFFPYFAQALTTILP